MSKPRRGVRLVGAEAKVKRIAILGNSAGGKSTLARHLSKTQKITHVEIDALYWAPDWFIVPPEIYNRAHDAAIAQDSWIIDGGGDLASTERRLERATKVILVDLPLWMHFWRAAERQMAWADSSIEDPPGGGQSMPPTRRLFEIIWEVDRDWMPKLRALCDAQKKLGKTVTRLTTLEDFEAMLTSK